MVTADANGIHAIRKGPWKYIDNTPPEGLEKARPGAVKNFKPQLYNLVDDPSESINLYDKKPEIVKVLLEELNQIRKSGFNS